MTSAPAAAAPADAGVPADTGVPAGVADAGVPADAADAGVADSAATPKPRPAVPSKGNMNGPKTNSAPKHSLSKIP